MATATRSDVGAEVEGLSVSAYTVPTDGPESDGTLEWDSTTMVVVEAHGAGRIGLGYTYGDLSVGRFVESKLAEVAAGADAMAPPQTWARMQAAIRNAGRPGVGAMAISAVDVALWDLKARLLDVPLTLVLPRFHEAVPIYGSGGFTSYSDDRLAQQLRTWASLGIPGVKMKVGRDPGRDPHRVAVARDAIGDDVELMVDANGGYTVGEARRIGGQLDELGVVWFEEPVSSDDVEVLARLRGVLRCDVAAGEYVADAREAARLGPAVDCLQLDVTRCGGYTGWLRCAAVAAAAGLPVSGHCAPSLHAPVAAALPGLRHVEWFADHARLEPLLVDGVPAVADGALQVPGAPGHGMTLRPGAERWRTA
jgi:L-alanine-DL-glutamate epimerase-like enolase superfamily enzyme